MVPNLLFSAADSGLLALVGLRADPVQSGWYWTQRSRFTYSKTNSVLAYSTRSEKYENPTAGPKEPVPWEGDPCNQLLADQLGAKRSRGFILVGGCHSCRLGACSKRRLITGMGYPLLKIPWRGLFSFWCCRGLQASFVLEAWRAATTTHLFFWIVPYVRSSVTLVPVVWTFQDMEVSDHKAMCLGLRVMASKLKSGIGAMRSWQNTLLNTDLCLWLQPWKHFKDMLAFTVSSEDGKKEKTMLLLSRKRICALWIVWSDFTELQPTI